MKDQANSLNEFQWDQSDDDNTFFGQVVDKNDVGDLFQTPETEEGEEDKDKKKKVVKPITDPDANFDEFEDREDPNDPFVIAEKKAAALEAQAKKDKEKKDKEDTSDNSDEGSEGDNESVNDDEDKFFNTFAEELKEKGILSTVEIPTDKVLKEDEFYDLVEEEFDNKAWEKIEGTFEDIGPDGKAFLQYMKNGGTNARDFLEIYSATQVAELDLEKEDQQDLAIRQYIISIEGETDKEIIQGRIDFYKESGKKKDMAEKFYNKLQAIDTANKAEVLKKNEELAKANQKAREDYNKSITDKLAKTEQIGNISFKTTDKKALISNITKATVKVGENKYITPLTKKITEIFQSGNEEKLLQLAKIVMEDFDMKDVVAAKETKVVERTKNKLKEAKQGGGSHRQIRNNSAEHSLASLFND